MLRFTVTSGGGRVRVIIIRLPRWDMYNQDPRGPTLTFRDSESTRNLSIFAFLDGTGISIWFLGREGRWGFRGQHRCSIWCTSGEDSGLIDGYCFRGWRGQGDLYAGRCSRTIVTRNWTDWSRDLDGLGFRELGAAERGLITRKWLRIYNLGRKRSSKRKIMVGWFEEMSHLAIKDSYRRSEFF